MNATAEPPVLAPSPGPGRSPGFLLWHATLRWQRTLSGALRPLGLTHVQFVLLAAVWWLGTHGEEPPQRRVAAFTAVDPMMASQVLRGLEARGLLERRPDPADGRARRLSVTDQGGALAVRAIAVVEAVDADLFGDVPDLGALLGALQVLSGGVTGDGR